MSVLVYTENWDGRFKKSTYELVSYAKAIATELKLPLVALSIGNVSEAEFSKLELYGADKLVLVNTEKLHTFVAQAYTHTVYQVAKAENASVLLFNNNYTGRSLAPRLSVKLNAGTATGVVKLPASYAPFIVRKSIYTGKAFADVELLSAVKILTLNQNSFEIRENATGAKVEVREVEVLDKHLAAMPTKVEKASGKMNLTDAEIVISGGRGLKGPENWGMVEELADLLGAGTACSRPVADSEWRPHHEHVGQTGKVVRPNLYIAIGISGAIQHLAGVNSSKVLVAINNDPEAPFFEAADYGIVGDAFAVVPKIIDAVKAMKASH